MIIGIGIDIVEISRFEAELARGEWSFANGVFTPEEIAYCSNSQNAAAQYAQCFAAKEAALKAFGVQVGNMGVFREAEVHAHCSHEYTLTFHGRLKTELQRTGTRNIHLSIGRSSQHTIAMVILEG